MIVKSFVKGDYVTCIQDIKYVGKEVVVGESYPVIATINNAYYVKIKNHYGYPVIYLSAYFELDLKSVRDKIICDILK